MKRLIAAFSLLLSGPSFAQGYFDAHGFYLAPDDADLADHLVTWRPEAQIPGSLGVLGLFEFADTPLMSFSTGEDEDETVVLDDLFGLNLGLHGGLHERIGLAATVPIFFASTGPDGAQGAAFGDARIHVPVALLALDDTKDSSAGFSLVPFTDVPIGANAKFLGNKGLSAGLLAAGGYATGSLGATLNLGLQFTPNIDYLNLNGGGKGLVGLGVGYAFGDSIAAHLEANLRASFKKNEQSLTESPAEVLASVRGRHGKGLSWNAGGSAALTRGASAATYRFFAGMGWRYGKDGGGDPDRDGIRGKLDNCPQEPETANGYRDDDGCPDQLASVQFIVRDPEGQPLQDTEILVDMKSIGRTDPAGRLDVEHLIPETTLEYELVNAMETGLQPTILGSIALVPGPQDEIVDVGWMPGAVRIIARGYDGALLDATITFASAAETYSRKLPSSGEQIFVLAPDDWAVVASHDFYGTARRDLTIRSNETQLLLLEFVLEPPKVQVTKREVRILEQILFDFDSAEIKEESLPIVEQVANVLVQYPEIELVEIQGHTDSRGSASYNRGLSQRRMDSVMTFLVGRGLDSERLLPVGYGEDCPLASNATAAGREKNRRVQFFIAIPEPEEPIPCRRRR
jgi:outer membrane protein OmpA-like peptidoglycan-associated protein